MPIEQSGLKYCKTYLILELQERNPIGTCHNDLGLRFYDLQLVFGKALSLKSELRLWHDH
jgi:hypothetical protein